MSVTPDMEPPVYPRNSAFPWALKPEDSPSRCSSYSMKFPSMRSNDYDTLKPASSSYGWSRDNVSSASGFSWQQPPGFMFSYPTNMPHAKEEPNAYRYSTDAGYVKCSNIQEPITQAQAAPEQASFSNLSESNSNGASANRSAKRHVKSACFNCKKAHLSCDESRPCTRCKQTGKVANCYDVPQRRKGRPRLQHNGMRKTGRDIMTKPLSAKPLIMAQDPRNLHSFPYFDIHPDMAFAMDNGNDYPQLPVAFLDIDLHLVRTNQAFKSIFSYLGDVTGCKLEHLIETIDLGILDTVRWALRQEIEIMMSQSVTQLKTLEYPEPGRLPSPDSPDPAGIQKTPVRREQIHFRFADGQSRPLPVEFCVARTAVAFVTLTLPPLRNALSVLPSYQQHERGIMYPLNSPYGHMFDPMRSYYARPTDRSGPLPSPDSSSYFSMSPSSSSFSLSSAGSSSLSATSRHPSIVSHRSSYEIPFTTSVNPTVQAPPVANITVNSPTKQVSQASNLSLPQPKGFYSGSSQLAPLQDRDQSLLNSRRLPPLTGLTTQSSGAQEASGVEGRVQQNAWPSPDSDTASQGDKKHETWRNENSTGNRSRLGMKELAA